MKIKILWCENSDWLRSEELYINDVFKESVGPLCECPEDAIIGRDLISCEDIVKYIKLGYEAGKSGEKLEYEIIENKESQDGKD